MQHAIEEVLEQGLCGPYLFMNALSTFSAAIDEDLAAMYLTDKKRSTPRGLNEHEDLEVLLESFAKQVEEIVNEGDNMTVSDRQTVSFS